MQIARIMKPGTYYSAYDWYTTPKYDGKNPEHRRVVDDVAEGNALPAVRTPAHSFEAAKAAGLELVEHYDVALGADIPWQVTRPQQKMLIKP